MDIRRFQVDAFTTRVFGGNPAAVCPLDAWLDDATLQAIAEENNLPATAFLVPEGDRYCLRWLSPRSELELCGHATLATAWVIFNRLKPHLDEVRFDSKAGELVVTRNDDGYTLDLPSIEVTAVAEIPGLEDALGAPALELFRSRDIVAVLENESGVRSIAPDMAKLTCIKTRGIIVTAPGTQADFVSRFFAPSVGIQEDPVTGSAHCALTPFWSKRLGKKAMRALQLSARGGELFCEDHGSRVKIAGKAALFSEGVIYV